jgi:hypothetical protein
VAYFETLSWNLAGHCIEKHEKLLSFKPVSVFETGHFKIQCRNSRLHSLGYSSGYFAVRYVAQKPRHGASDCPNILTALIAHLSHTIVDFERLRHYKHFVDTGKEA